MGFNSGLKWLIYCLFCTEQMSLFCLIIRLLLPAVTSPHLTIYKKALYHQCVKNRKACNHKRSSFRSRKCRLQVEEPAVPCSNTVFKIMQLSYTMKLTVFRIVTLRIMVVNCQFLRSILLPLSSV
jgi:hypothetical protein